MENIDIKNKKYGFVVVRPLLNSSILKILDFLPNYLPSCENLPANIKDTLINLMSKRGLITDQNISLITHGKVRILDLTDSDFTDKGLVLLAKKCPQLRKIDLNSITKNSRTGITTTGITALAEGCKYLQVVYLRRCTSITDDCIIALSQHCPHLQDLNIGGCNLISDRTLQTLGQHSRHLRSLNVSKANITDDGVLSLVSQNTGCLQSLKELHIAGCTNITDEAVEAVIQFCPNIQVFIFHSCPNLTDQSRVALEELAGENSKMKQVTWTVY